MENKSRYFSQTFTVAFLVSAAAILSTLMLSSFIGFDAPPEVADQIANEVENLAATTN
jgi:hypothetical protein